jgi:hypothetical protein
MKNATLTSLFLNSTDLKVKNEILTNIANHYGISIEQAYEEVTDEDAESLLDYLTGSIRSSVSVLIQRFKYNLR